VIRASYTNSKHFQYICSLEQKQSREKLLLNKKNTRCKCYFPCASIFQLYVWSFFFTSFSKVLLFHYHFMYTTVYFLFPIFNCYFEFLLRFQLNDFYIFLRFVLIFFTLTIFVIFQLHAGTTEIAEASSSLETVVVT
jgi:hypothetical protein